MRKHEVVAVAEVGAEVGAVYMGRSSFRMELAPFSLGDDDDDGVVSPVPEISTAPFDARAPEPLDGALPLVEVRRDLTEKLRLRTAAKTLSLSFATVAGIGVAAFVAGLLTALAFSPPAPRPLVLPAAPPPPVVESLPAPPPDVPALPGARPAPARPVRRARPPAPSSAWSDPFAE